MNDKRFAYGTDKAEGVETLAQAERMEDGTVHISVDIVEEADSETR